MRPYIGCVKAVTAAGYRIDHLHSAISNSDIRWKYQSNEDIQTAEKKQIINYIVGE